MIRVKLHLGNDSTHGTVTFHSLLLNQEGAVTCEPPGVLTAAEIEQVGAELRHLPQINRGQVGQFQWVEERT